MPRFVVLRHELPPASARPSHWDLMLEDAATGKLWTWAVGFPVQPGQAGPVQRLPDHRLAYLDFEGPISGDRGTVRRCVKGTYELVEHADDQIRARLRVADAAWWCTLRLRRLPGEQHPATAAPAGASGTAETTSTETTSTETASTETAGTETAGTETASTETAGTAWWLELAAPRTDRP